MEALKRSPKPPRLISTRLLPTLRTSSRPGRRFPSPPESDTCSSTNNSSSSTSTISARKSTVSRESHLLTLPAMCSEATSASSTPALSTRLPRARPSRVLPLASTFTPSATPRCCCRYRPLKLPRINPLVDVPLATLSCASPPRRSPAPPRS